MNIKEFLLGTDREKKTQDTINKLRSKPQLKPGEVVRLQEAQGITRRLFFRRTVTAIAGGVATTALGAAFWLRRSNSEPTNPKERLTPEWYPRLYQYRDRELPGSLTSQIATDMVDQKDFPFIVRSGQYILDNLQRNQTTSPNDRPFNPQDRTLTVRFTELGSTIATYEDVGMVKGRDKKVELKAHNEDRVVRFTGVDELSTIPFISLNSHLLDPHVMASHWVIKLMMAKEGSHPLYFPEAKRKMLEDVRKSFEIPDDRDFENMLVASAITAGHYWLDEQGTPFLSNTFNNMVLYIDYAGYGHIALDLAKIRDKGLLNPKDKEILEHNLLALDEALKRGVIVKNPSAPNIYTWSTGNSPYSEKWFEIIGLVHQPTNRR